MIPRRRKKPKMGLRVSDKIHCPAHARWVRGFECLIAGKATHECWGRMEAHHVTSRGAGGGDETLVPLCSRAHVLGHSMGWDSFEKLYGVNLEATAAELWRTSPHGQRYRLENPGA